MTISDLEEQRDYVKFCFKIWKPASEIPEMRLDFVPLEPRNQTLVLSVEVVNVDRQRGLLLRTSRSCWWGFLLWRYIFMMNCLLQAKRIASNTTRRFCNGPREQVRLTHREQQQIRARCYTMTARLPTLLYRGSTLIAHLIWPLIISSFFGKWNSRFEGIVLRKFLKLRNNLYASCARFQKVISRSASRNVRTR